MSAVSNSSVVSRPVSFRHAPPVRDLRDVGPAQEAYQSMAHSRMVRRELTVELENGLHMTPCSAIAKAARDFGGPVRIIHGQITADASSVFDLLGLGAARGTVLTLEADGDGAESLLDRLAALFQKEFDVRR